MVTHLRLANRVARLGVETAFVVASKAAAFEAEGNTVYPFHLGDLNLTTPENIIDAAYAALRKGKTGYTPNTGIPQLREMLAYDFNKSRGTNFGPENIAIQPGGKPVISKFLLTVMNPGDEVLYPNPGFPIYESQIAFHGGIPVAYTIVQNDDGFTFDIEGLKKSITDKTRVLIVNDLHNPTSAECSEADRKAIAELAVAHNLLVLIDEAYFDVRYEGVSSSIVTEPGMRERSVVLYTFSKKFAMTGWRLGAAIGPLELIEVIGKLNVNDESCTNHFVQYAALEALEGDQKAVRLILARLQKRRDLCVDILNDIRGVHCFRPNATFYLYPDVTVAMENKGFQTYDELLDSVLRNTGVSMCAREHFGTPLSGELRKHVRLAYSGIGRKDIETGLMRLKYFLEA